MEKELLTVIEVRVTSGKDQMADSEIWSAANEILRRSNKEDRVQAKWVTSFKKRHGFLNVPTATVVSHPTSIAKGCNRFTAGDDVHLLQHALVVKPWACTHPMDGWLRVVQALRREENFSLTGSLAAGTCCERVKLLVHQHLADAPIHQTGTAEEHTRIAELVRQVDESSRTTRLEPARSELDTENSTGALARLHQENHGDLLKTRRHQEALLSALKGNSGAATEE